MAMHRNEVRLACVWKLLTHLDDMQKRAAELGYDPEVVLELVRMWLASGNPQRPAMEGVPYSKMRQDIRVLLDEWGIQ